MKDYMGDSVYAAWDGYAVTLTTENGFPGDPSNVVVMEPAVLEALDRFRRRIALVRAALATAPTPEDA